MKHIHWEKLLLAIALCQSAGVIGSLFTIQSIPTWFITLHKPIFNPPNWIFGPVWFFLYTLMGIALYRLWYIHGKKHQTIKLIRLFYIHLVVNALWSIIFFGAHNIAAALIDILVLWWMVLVIVRKISTIDLLAFYCLVPYFLWVSFALLLNYSFLLLNN